MLPERIFERRWALSVLEIVVDRLRDEFVQHGRLDQFNRLKVFLVDQPEMPHAALAREMGMSEAALRWPFTDSASAIVSSFEQVSIPRAAPVRCRKGFDVELPVATRQGRANAAP